MIGNFDVGALYPSININFAGQKWLELISEIEFKSVDTLELGLYLSLLMDENIYDFCPTRGCGRPPTINSSGSRTTYEKSGKDGRNHESHLIKL